MRLVLIFVGGLLLESHASMNNDYILLLTTLMNSALVPDVIPEAPHDILGVYYPNAVVCLGNEIPFTHTILKPRLEYENTKPGVNYTLLFINPDIPSAAAPAVRIALHWIVVNIPGGDLEAGDTMADYIPLIMNKYAGYRRYIFLLYAQKRMINALDGNLIQIGIRRSEPSITNLERIYDLELVAGNHFKSSFETTQRDCRA